MALTHVCDSCGGIIKNPTLTITRTDGFGGGGIRISADQPWHLCTDCAQRIDNTLGALGVEHANREAQRR
jgi:hypothetical protein